MKIEKLYKPKDFSSHIRITDGKYDIFVGYDENHKMIFTNDILEPIDSKKYPIVIVTKDDFDDNIVLKSISNHDMFIPFVINNFRFLKTAYE